MTSTLISFTPLKTDYGKCAHTRRKRINSNGHSKDWVTWVYERVPGHQLALIESTSNNQQSSSTSSSNIDALTGLLSSTSSNNFIQSSSPSYTTDYSSSSSPPSSINSWTNSPYSDTDYSFPFSSPLPSAATVPSFISSASTVPSSSGHTFSNNPSSYLDSSASLESNGNYFFDSAGRSKESLPSNSRDKHETFDRHNSNGKFSSKPRYLDVPSLGGLRNLQVLDVRVSSLLRCAEACLQETSFLCLSANFLRVRS